MLPTGIELYHHIVLKFLIQEVITIVKLVSFGVVCSTLIYTENIKQYLLLSNKNQTKVTINMRLGGRHSHKGLQETEGREDSTARREVTPDVW